MTFEGHTDRAPRLLPHREQGEALLAVRETAPAAPSDEGIDLFAVPAGEVQGHGFDLSRFHRLSRLQAAPNRSVSFSLSGTAEPRSCNRSSFGGSRRPRDGGPHSRSITHGDESAAGHLGEPAGVVGPGDRAGARPAGRSGLGRAAATEVTLASRSSNCSIVRGPRRAPLVTAAIGDGVTVLAAAR